MDHPYNSQPDSAFWRRAIGDRSPEDIGDWYTKRFSLDGKAVATAGSCFAQHIGRQLRDAGFAYIDKEPPPAGLPAEEHLDWGYSMYSARYGNIYTSRQLVQLIDRAQGRFSPVEDWWEKDGGIVDPFRPTIEPEPFGSVDEMRALRAEHLEAVTEVFKAADVLVFTMGLTEAWLSKRDGACYPLCPGTAGGTYDDSLHRLHNLGSADVRADMEDFLTKVRLINPKLEILLTVSPVSMMATATPRQVSVATIYTKSVLRAVAGELYDAHENIDYFPSYDMVTGPSARGAFYKAGMREVAPEGVAYVMSHFLAEHVPGQKIDRAAPLPAADPAAGLSVQATSRPAPRMAPPSNAAPEMNEDDIKCDEELLNAFGRQTGG